MSRLADWLEEGKYWEHHIDPPPECHTRLRILRQMVERVMEHHERSRMGPYWKDPCQRDRYCVAEELGSFLHDKDKQ